MGDTEALFLKKFSGEVLVSFRRASVTMGRHMVKTITEGKSAQFPVTGRATAFYHTPGAEILGQTIAHNERVITMNDLLISPVFIPLIDEAMNHYETRSIYSGEMGVALATQMDRHVLQTMLQAADGLRGAAGDHPEGSPDYRHPGPVMNQDRLIVNRKVVLRDRETSAMRRLSPNDPMYRLFHQMTRLTRERGSLIEDNRLDAIAVAAQWSQFHMATDIEKAIEKRKEEALAEQPWRSARAATLRVAETARGRAINAEMANRRHRPRSGASNLN